MDIRNPRYVEPNKIDCEINHEIYGWIPFTASENDTEQHGRGIYTQLIAAGGIAAYAPPTSEQLAIEVKEQRDSELTWFDSVCYRNQFYWSSLTQSQQTERLTFRTLLLGVPEQSGFPTSITWPIRPKIEESEYEMLVVKNNTPSDTQLWADYQAKAQALLYATDIVALRCWKAGVVYPPEWLDYTNKLRAIVRAPSGDSYADFPPRPSYPEGT